MADRLDCASLGGSGATRWRPLAHLDRVHRPQRVDLLLDLRGRRRLAPNDAKRRSTESAVHEVRLARDLQRCPAATTRQRLDLHQRRTLQMPSPTVKAGWHRIAICFPREERELSAIGRSGSPATASASLDGQANPGTARDGDFTMVDATRLRRTACVRRTTFRGARRQSWGRRPAWARGGGGVVALEVREEPGEADRLQPSEHG